MRWLAFLALVALLFFLACEQVDFTAPGGSSLTLTAQPKSVDKNGTSSLTATGIRANGAPLPDETLITFTVDGAPGAVNPNPVKTQNGIARAMFIAGQQSGKATIKAVSGDVESEAVEITIGDARASKLVLTADPSGLPIGGGKTKLKAFVLDEDGNPVSGIQVFFKTDAGTLASKGTAVLTNSSGIAQDTLTTASEAQVTAETSGSAESDSITITVAEGEPPTCDSSVSPSSVAVGQKVFFVDISTDPDGEIRDSSWDFGDGKSAGGFSVSHSYSVDGTFTVVHSVTDDQGFTAICAPATVQVQAGTPPQCSFSASPSGSVDVGQQIAFTDTSTDADGQVTDSDWDFGDGNTAQGKNVTHTYNASGTYNVLHTVTDDQGISTNCSPLSITVNFVGSPPTCSFTFTPPSTGSFVVSFNASASHDNDESNQSITTYQWDFGDGESTSTSNPLTSHNYTSAGSGTYQATVTVTDDEGDTANCAAQSVTVPGT